MSETWAGREDRPAHQARALVDREVHLVAEQRLLRHRVPAGILVAAALDRLALARPPAVGGDQRGVDQRARLDHQPPGVELAVELGQQPLGQPPPDQLAAKARQGRVVRHRVGQRQADEAAGSDEPVRQRLLEPRVGQPVPLLQQQAAQQHQRPVGRPPDRRRIDLAEQPLERRPVDQRRDPLQLPVAPRAALDQTVRQSSAAPAHAASTPPAAR